MQTIIVLIIIAAAAAFLIRRFIKYGAGGTCGCSCTGCDTGEKKCPAKNEAGEKDREE